VDEGRVLAGGLTNAGSVVRIGDVVVRPATPYSATTHAVLRHVRRRGFLAVPEPIGIIEGREHLSYVEGDSLPDEWPAWVFSDATVASAARLLRRFHDATRDFVAPPGALWNPALADPEVGDVICQGDACLGNVTFTDGLAVGMIDFEYVSPGRAATDVGSFIRQSIPLVPAHQADDRVPAGLDPIRLIVLVAEAYEGLTPDEVVGGFEVACDIADRFWHDRLAAHDPVFTAKWHELDQGERIRQRWSWLAEHREQLLDALGDQASS
jgi:hypothetical protein